MDEPRRFALNPMDNIMPRFNINFILTFGLKPSVPFQQVHDLLQASLQSAADELLIFRRRVFAVPAAHDQTHQTTAGRLEAREHPDWTPQDELDGAQLLPPAPMDLDPEGAAAIVAQANFVHGGFLLAVCHFHSLVDGMSGSLLLKMWAKHLRIHQGVDEGTARLDIPLSNCDYDLVPRASQKAGNKVPSPHEVKVTVAVVGKTRFARSMTVRLAMLMARGSGLKLTV
ncbi:hypothetical protein MFIFM68171_08434 [Madurella fahalii]|uniref:Uncharacterized protein n=1 Tax=Madurella fahalii TaxID=1157608 RepID=A0ABQ0GKK4_9PEZI